MGEPTNGHCFLLEAQALFSVAYLVVEIFYAYKYVKCVIFHIPSCCAVWWNKNLSCIPTGLLFIAYSIETTKSLLFCYCLCDTMTGAHLLDELIVSVPDYRESMNDSISILSESLKQNSSQSSSSHCWEEDGSFHSVCIFVLAVSGVCSLATFITVYRVILMIIAAVRYLVIVINNFVKGKL